MGISSTNSHSRNPDLFNHTKFQNTGTQGRVKTSTSCLHLTSCWVLLHLSTQQPPRPRAVVRPLANKPPSAPTNHCSENSFWNSNMHDYEFNQRLSSHAPHSKHEFLSHSPNIWLHTVVCNENLTECWDEEMQLETKLGMDRKMSKKTKNIFQWWHLLKCTSICF